MRGFGSRVACFGFRSRVYSAWRVLEGVLPRRPGHRRFPQDDGVYGVGVQEAVTPLNKVMSPPRYTPPYSGLYRGGWSRRGGDRITLRGEFLKVFSRGVPGTDDSRRIVAGDLADDLEGDLEGDPER